MALAIYKDLCIDAENAHNLGAFYAHALGLTYEDDGRDAVLRGPTPAHTIWVNKVPYPRSVKNRVHLDIHAENPFSLIGAGARPEPDQDFDWLVMTDPEGQEFCVFERESPPDYRLYEICVDCADARELALWWGEVFGVPAETEEGKDFYWLQKIPGVPFDGFTFVNVPEEKSVKNRVHWDVVGDTDALLMLGASMITPRDPGVSDWDVLADPEGNEFCVFPPP
jgi:hypothetical protein